MNRTERWGWRLAGLLACLLMLLCMFGCVAPQTKAEGGSTKWEKTTAPASVVSEKNIEEIIAAADGSTITRKIAERTTAPPVTVTERAESKGPSVQGPGAEKAKLGPSTAGPDGAKAGEADATWRKVIPPGKEWILLIIGGTALVGGAALAWKAPTWGAPALAAGSACLAFYFYPVATLAIPVAAGVWLGYDLWQSRQAANKAKQTQALADEAATEAARQQAALAVVTKAVANSDASTKAAVKRKVADTIAAGSDLDAAIQEAKRT